MAASSASVSSSYQNGSSDSSSSRSQLNVDEDDTDSFPSESSRRSTFTSNRILPLYSIVLTVGILAFGILTYVQYFTHDSSLPPLTTNKDISKSTKDEWKQLETYDKNINAPVARFDVEQTSFTSFPSMRTAHDPNFSCDRCRPEFHGKVVLVTGGSTGIGFSTVLNFAQKGAKVVFCARNKTRGYEALDAILSDPVVQLVHGFTYSRASTIRRADLLEHQPVAYLPADISDLHQIKDLIRGTVALFGTIDIAVNNAGVLGYAGRITGVPDDIFGSPADVLQINMYGTLYSVIEELRLWEEEAKQGKRDQGVIVNIASVEGQNGFPGTSIYASSKFAIIGLTKSVAGEYASGNGKATNGLRVRCNAIAPGPIDTPMVWDSARLYLHGEQEWQGERIMSPDNSEYQTYKKEVLDSKFPGGRIGSPQDIADAVLFLSSHKADFISGSVLTVDNTLTSTAVKFL